MSRVTRDFAQVIMGEVEIADDPADVTPETALESIRDLCQIEIDEPTSELTPESEVERLRAALEELRICQVDEVLERDDEGRAVVGFTRDMTAKEVRDIARRALEETDG